MRETEVNCDAARFFLRQTVGVRAGQRLDQRALAMINVARRGNNEMVLCHSRAVSSASPANDLLASQVSGEQGRSKQGDQRGNQKTGARTYRGFHKVPVANAE